jgi:hypothetical protein
MAFTRSLPDASWATLDVLPATTLRDIDVRTTQAINGDGGGTYSPSAQIIIGGAGLVLQGMMTAAGPNIDTDNTDAHAIVFDDGALTDSFVLEAGHTGQTRYIVDHVSGYGNALEWRADTAWLGGRAERARGHLYAPLRVHAGARLLSVQFWFILMGVTASENMPDELPRYRIVRVRHDGTVEPLRAPDTTTTARGWQVHAPAPATAAAWGGLQNFTYSCNINNTNLDPSTYTYVAEVIADATVYSGGAEPWSVLSWTSTRAYFDSITRVGHD